MEVVNPPISQKEYLKKYLSKGKSDQKKKKKKHKISSSTHIKRSVIIDDDLGLKDFATVDDDEFNLDYLGDEAPQIVGVIDERPPELLAKERHNDKMWKPLEGGDQIEANKEDGSDSDMSLPRNERNNQNVNSDKYMRKSDPHLIHSKDKVSKRTNDSNYSKGEESDLSPPRKKNDRFERSKLAQKERQNDKKWKQLGENHKDNSKIVEEEYDSDLSPPRNKRNRQNHNVDKYTKRGKPDTDFAYSKDRRTHSSYYSKSRRSKDSSPIRNRKDNYDHRSLSSSKHSYDETSSARKSSREHFTQDHDKYTNKHREHESEGSANKRRKHRQENGESFRIEDVNKEKRSGSNSHSHSTKKKRQESSEKDLHDGKLVKTLDGKTAGLQEAKHLKTELQKLKEKEDEMFKRMDPQLLGKSAAPVVRDKKTGLKRNLEKEKEDEFKKAEKSAVRQEKYTKWGKGLKQVRDREEKAADMLYEMSKPLARYKDDEDLDRYLRAQEREGDPMLEYIRKQQMESYNVIDLSTSTSSKPRYQGNFMPNRFGIAPGHRWDGVDRSNGYEKQWFEHRNARKALEEEAFKWSTSDM